MDKQMIWSLESYDNDEGWTNVGFFSTREKAKQFYKTLIEKEPDDSDYRTYYRIVWHYLDPE